MCMAMVYKDQGKYDQALEIHKSVLETKIRLCGHTHLSVAHSYNNLAMVYRAQNKYEEALEMLSKSLEIKTRVYASDNHLSVADD